MVLDRDEVVGEDKLKCMVCEKLISRYNIMEHRINSHSDAKAKCKLCYKELKRAGIYAHLKNVHGSEEEQNYLKNEFADALIITVDFGKDRHSEKQHFQL